MANPTVTLEGRLASDPELRFTQDGKPVVSFTIVTSDSKRVGEQWEDRDTSFWRCTAWDAMAEHINSTLAKGMAVVAVAKMREREYQTKDGEKRKSVDFTVNAIGPSLRHQVAHVQKSSGGGASGSQAASNEGWGTGTSGSNSGPSRGQQAPQWAQDDVESLPPF